MLGYRCPLTDIVKRVEKGELQPDPKHLIDLRLN
jgi:2-dehydropantoate 2-reductase